MAQYFEKYRGAEQVSLVNALAEMGENSTYSQRERIAAANGIANYTGTALQNLQMLSLLKSGDLIKPNGETQTSTSTDNNTPPRRRWVMGGLTLAGIALVGKMFGGRANAKSKAADKRRKKRKNNRKRK
ncbi:MAG: hypothetical protein J5651_00530 [Salinivirgaceae bacterium]|nr:hypothetical protein [Salinivirgaceae bacterium]